MDLAHIFKPLGRQWVFTRWPQYDKQVVVVFVVEHQSLTPWKIQQQLSRKQRTLRFSLRIVGILEIKAKHIGRFRVLVVLT